MQNGKKTKSLARLDEKVILSMILVAVLAFGVLAFRYKTYTPCTPAKIKISSASGNESSTYYVGDQVQFSADLTGATKFEWSVDDKNGFKSNGVSPFYEFTDTGNYTVTLKLKGNCESQETIVVVDRPEAALPRPSITFKPATPKVGTKITFSDTTNSADTWSWDFGVPNSRSIQKSPSFTYKDPGTYTVTLRLNDNPKRESSVTVTVEKVDLSEGSGGGTAPPPSLCPVISEPEFIAMLLKVVEGKTVFAESFAQYMDGDIDIPIILNNVNRKNKGQYTQTFREMCIRLDKLKGKKINRFEKVTFQKNGQGCIIGLTVDVDISTDYL